MIRNKTIFGPSSRVRSSRVWVTALHASSTAMMGTATPDIMKMAISSIEDFIKKGKKQGNTLDGTILGK